MNQLYNGLDYGKQAFHQWKGRYLKKLDKTSLVLNILQQVRKDHPGMGVRTVWEYMRPGIGRDEFEYIAITQGFGVERKRKFSSTTNSYGVTRFDNLIGKMVLTDVNQVWVSDITYYRILDRFYYITLIMDLYSRKLIGYSVSNTLETIQTTLPALDYALKVRSGMCRAKTIIFHSDGGGQYYYKEWITTLRQQSIVSSMSTSVYENSHAERLNRTIKNQYIYRYGPSNFNQLKKATAKACLMYNEKPHRALKKKTPNEFEKLLILEPEK